MSLAHDEDIVLAVLESRLVIGLVCRRALGILEYNRTPLFWNSYHPVNFLLATNPSELCIREFRINESTILE